jgi:phosphoglycolate phosphatase
MLYIFDWDGTLCDSTEKIISCLQNAADELNFPSLSHESAKNIIGLGLVEAINVLYPDICLADAHRLKDKYVQHFTVIDQSKSELFPTVIETLEILRNDGHQLAVATGKSRLGLDRALKDLSLSGYFHGSRCADESGSKPQPQMLHELLQELTTPVEQAVMIGDTEYDLDMAQRAKMKSIGVDYGAHHVDRLKPFNPVFLISKMEQLLHKHNVNLLG